MRRSLARTLHVPALVLAAQSAHATYSIVASDAIAREAGGAGTSCLRGSRVSIIYGSVPGVGVVHAQATFNGAGRDRAVELLDAGLNPAAILDAITASSFDRDVELRQYAVVDVSGRVAAFTGSRTQAYAGDRQGSSGSFTYSVQGNILTSESVLAKSAAAFESAGCDLAERLMRALEAGAENGEGDSRCTNTRGIPADSAFIQIERPDTDRGSYLALEVPTSGDDDPLVLLRAAFDAWRATHPCPDGSGLSGAAGGAGAGGAGAGAGAGAASGASAAGASPGAGRSAATTEAEGDASCGCRAAGSLGSRAWMCGWIALAAAILRRRRRRWNVSAHRCYKPPPCSRR